MIVGILSDTHGRADAMKAAVQLLTERGAQYLFHCGDVGSTAVLDHLAGLRAGFVWGNNDWEREELQSYARLLGVTCFGSLGEPELGGKKFAVMHGDDFHLRGRLLKEQRHDYLLQGHTHVRRDERIGTVRCINPGALYRAREKTVALLDTVIDEITWLTVDT